MFAEPLWQTLLPTIMYFSSIELADKCQSHSNFRCGLSCRLGALPPCSLECGGSSMPPPLSMVCAPLEANKRYVQPALQKRHLPVSYLVAIVEGPEKSFSEQFKRVSS